MKKIISKYNRITYIDLYKSIGIILMIMGHVGFGNLFEKCIHAFHMPLFFFISGFLFKGNNRSFNQVLKKKTKTLLIPYIMWGVISLGIYFSFKGFDIGCIRIFLWDNTRGIAISGALCFLTALFIADLIFFFVEKIVKKIYIKISIYISLSIIGILFPKTAFLVPFALCPAMVGTGFMAIGFYYKKINEKIEKSLLLSNSALLNVVFVIFGELVAQINITVNMRTSTYGNCFLFYVSSIMICIGLLNFSKWIDKKMKIKFLLTIGENSIIFVCANQLVIYAIGFICNRIGIYDGLLFKSLFFLLTILILWIVNIAISNTKLKFLIGR